jgi:SAM-dependent methyltransferase
VTALSDKDRTTLIDRYVARFDKHGVDAQTLNIGDPAKYARQHAIHAAVGPLEGATVLDFGCGLASFYEHVRAKGIRFHYIGYDVVEPFIAANRIRFPEAMFRIADVSKDRIVDRCDYVVMCQVFNNKYRETDNVEVVKGAIHKAFQAVEKGLSIDMLSSYVSRRQDHLCYYSPEHMFSFSKSLTPYVSLLHGYLEHHFTIQLFKQKIGT